MKAHFQRLFGSSLALAGIWLGAPDLSAQPQPKAPPPVGTVRVLAVEGPAGGVEWMRRDAPGVWEPVAAHQPLLPGDGLRTGPLNRTLLKFSDLGTFWLDKRSQIHIPPERKPWRVLELLRGAVFFFHRDREGDLEIRTRLQNALVRGTEFNVRVADDDTTVLTLLDGEVEMSNEFGRLTLTGGQEGRAEPGKAPAKTTAVLHPLNVIQWCLYYPGVLDLDELPLPPEAAAVLEASRAAYRSGDVLAALAHYPPDRHRQAVSSAEKVYQTALVLAVGQVDLAEEWIQSVEQSAGRDSRPAALATALRQLIATVKLQPSAATRNPQLSTALLAESYYLQSQYRRDRLEAALAAAREAVNRSTNFAFGWARVAELEFSFGRIHAARVAVERSLQLAPRNAQAHALKGFLAAARNDIPEAIGSFEQAIAIDPALGNAWLGRGLCRIRQGQAEAGRLDLQVAATTEPQRALLRSYLGKAFSHAGDNPRAAKELELAKKLDPQDPTAWLYSALLDQQRNRINDGIRDLQTSEQVGDNRRVYRSQLLLEQDRAVRSANLARFFQDAGLIDVSVREAVRAVNADYANYSAHLFLANSYDHQRDPNQVNLRYETPWLSEYLLANLLAPVGAGPLSPILSQQEYSRLFERDRLGLVSSTEYRSNGDWFQEAAQFGTLGSSSYSIETAYRSRNGYRPNADLDQLTVSLQFKQQLTPRDSLFLQGIYYSAESGDVRQLYRPEDAHPNLRLKETQEPLVLAGYRHEWAPGSHTLFLAGRLQDTLRFTDPDQEALALSIDGRGRVTGLPYPALPTPDTRYQRHFDAYTAELQQIARVHRHSLILGGRFQAGTFDTWNELTDFGVLRFSTATNAAPVFIPPITDEVTTDFWRASAYAYDQWQVFDPLLLVAGISVDHLEHPRNIRSPPVSAGEETAEQISPKAGFIWTPTRHTTARFAYTRSLGGVSFEKSFQLEPSQVAGFNQSFRSLIPESAAGDLDAARFETFGASLEQQFGSGTFLGLTAEALEADAHRWLGDIEVRRSLLGVSSSTVATTPQSLRYQERSLLFTLNQLVGRDWAFGLRYRLSKAVLDSDLPAVPADVAARLGYASPQPHHEAVLHQLHLTAHYNHPRGFFAQAESIGSAQSNHGYSPPLAGDEFWQFNVAAGYRFPRRRAEVRLALLNLTDQDYRLNPLNLTAELPRERTVAVSFRFHF